MGSLAEREGFGPCASCGAVEAPYQLEFEPDGVTLCEDCMGRLHSGKAVSYWGPAEEEPLPPPEERFAELFKAARVLLREGIAEEDLIYPTLAYANELGQRVIDFEEEAGTLVSAYNHDDAAWETAVEQFLWNHEGMAPIRVADGVVILYWLPVDGGMRFYSIPNAEIPEEVTIRILPHTRPPEPEHIASVYENILSFYEASYGKSRAGSIDFEFAGPALLIKAYASTDANPRIPPEHAAAIFRERKPEFPHPRFLAEFCQMLLGSGSGDGFARYLAGRKRGGPPKPSRLIPACVAFYLREYGGLRGMEAHRLLNEHVLCSYGMELPEDGCSSSASTQLWRDARKAEQKLLATAHAIYDYDLEYTAYLVPRLPW